MHARSFTPPEEWLRSGWRQLKWILVARLRRSPVSVQSWLSRPSWCHTAGFTGPTHSTQLAAPLNDTTAVAPVNVLRTRVGVAPESIQRSERRPQMVAATAARR
jgi:hypothetical protein